MDPMIRMRGVSKIYGTGAGAVRALEEVDLDVDSGEILMLMGPSGSGKTTLLSIMGCILRPTSGSVQIAGREVAGLRESQLPRIRLSHIGFIFQGFNLFPALTAQENVAIAFDLKGKSKADARRGALELLDRVGIADKARTQPSDLSGGQKQRVAIARALAGEPDIILADEPTAALDSGSGKVVMELLSALALERGRAVVIVTHDSRVLNYGTRMIRIADGRVRVDQEQLEMPEVLA